MRLSQPLTHTPILASVGSGMLRLRKVTRLWWQSGFQTSWSTSAGSLTNAGMTSELL